MGASYTLLLLAFGRPFYRLLGGDGTVLESSLAYSNIVFAGATLVWLANTFSAMLRGTGNTLTPALVLAAVSVIHLPLSGSLVLGWGPMPQLGILGAGIAYVSTFGLAALLLGWVVLRPASMLRPHAGDLELERRLFGQILRVGAISVVSALQTVLGSLLLDGVRCALRQRRGRGLRRRTAPGAAADPDRVRDRPGARRTRRNATSAPGARSAPSRSPGRGPAMAACVSLSIGAVVRFSRRHGSHCSDSDPAVLAAGSSYLRTVGLAYPFLALGSTLYFAAQGAGKVLLQVTVAHRAARPRHRRGASLFWRPVRSLAQSSR
jgi:Na+-driven multidrug efflux pump